MTDEALNRNVLTWLKSWDEVVYPDRPRLNLKIPEHVFNSRARGNNLLMNTDIEYSFKNKKLILIHGPPGTGKSTMARILAQQCGYRTNFINASDERNGEKLVDLIKNATEMNTILDNE